MRSPTQLNLLPYFIAYRVYNLNLTKLVNEVLQAMLSPFCFAEYYKTILVHDEQLHAEGKALTITVFSKNMAQLPDCSERDILRMQRLQVMVYASLGYTYDLL